MQALKKSLRLIPLYVWIFLCCTCIVLFAYILYAYSCDIVAGQSASFQFRSLAIRSFFSVFPLVLIAITISLGFYRVRHPAGGFLSILIYVILCAFTWLVLYPTFIDIKSTFNHPALTSKTQTLSKGYFRVSEEGTLYFPFDLEESGTVVNIRSWAEEEHIISASNVDRANLFAESEPFQDSIIRSSIPEFPTWISAGYTLLTSLSENAREKGFTQYLSRISWALALCAMYGFTFCTAWRLLGILYLLIMDAGVLSFNILYHSSYFEKFRMIGQNFVSKISFLSYFDDAFLFFVNASLIIIAILVAILASAINHKRGGI
ncbi:MAG: hypothetical protein IJR49_02415 [Treponema sp.]|nr:hypothetical protein [Treponema sp.]